MRTAGADAVALPGWDAVVERGPSLLAGVHDGPGLAAHAARRGRPATRCLEDLAAAVDAVDLRGRGGAAFPFAAKLRAVCGARRVEVVVNACEGEPASAKDAALALLAPHLVLDGAVVTARAVGARTVHLVVPVDRPAVGAALDRAVAEREADRDGVTFATHRARPGFVSGQASAVVELLEGRENLPVTRRRPLTASGVRGRPTVLSNAETFAAAAVTATRRPRPEPGPTRLLTVDRGPARRRVCEVATGTPWAQVLGADVQRAVLVGGHHGRWVAPGALAGAVVTGDAVPHPVPSLGCGVVLVPPGCPISFTAGVVAHLAGESAGRCGPCVRGLPALASAFVAVASGRGRPAECERLAALVAGRGACHHPDGTVGLVRSALSTFPDELDAHAAGVCRYADDPSAQP